jgi:hypothetical protein
MTENNGMDYDDSEQDEAPTNPYESLLDELAVVAGTMNVRQQHPGDFGVEQAGVFYLGMMLCYRLTLTHERLDDLCELLVDLQTTLALNNRIALPLQEIAQSLKNINAAIEGWQDTRQHREQ